MRRASVLLAMLAVSACDVADAPAAACATEARQVLGADVLELTGASAPSLVGDHLVLLADAPARAYAVDACTGEATRLGATGLGGAFALTGEAGALALGHRQQDGAVLLLDRLDVPGVDEPRQIARLDPIDSGWYRWPEGLLLWSGPLMRAATGPSQVFFYPGPAGPLQPAASLASDVVWLARGGPGEFVVRTESGDLLRLIDGEASRVHSSVRRASLAPGGGQIVWQVAGGATTLHDFAADTSIDLRAAASLLRSAPDIEAWRWTDDAVAAVDTNGQLGAAHDRTTGARLAAPPPHVAVREDVPGPQFFLTVQLTPERVELAWDPRTGEAIEWYRGPDVELQPQRAGQGIRYLAEEQLWLHRPDLAPELLQPQASRDALVLRDGRALMSLLAEDETHTLVLLDESGARAWTIAEGVSRWSVTADEPPRLVHAIAGGPDAGVYISPLAAPLTGP